MPAARPMIQVSPNAARAAKRARHLDSAASKLTCAEYSAVVAHALEQHARDTKLARAPRVPVLMLAVSTESGSAYALDVDGTLTVRRQPEHPLPERETAQVEAVVRIGTRLSFQLKGARDGEYLLTSSLRSGSAVLLPEPLRHHGGVMRPADVLVQF